MADKEVPKLIQCGDHKWAPWALICVHVMEAEVPFEDWVPIKVDDGREVDFDYVCPDCAEEYDETGDWDINKLRAVCIHCLREIKEKAGGE